MPGQQAKQEALFRENRLLIQRGDERYCIEAWPHPQAHMRMKGEPWTRCYPEFRFIDYPYRKPKPKKKKPRMQQLGLALEEVKDADQAPAQTRKEAYELLRKTLPFKYAMSLARFQGWQYNLLVGLRIDKRFLDLLESNPTLAFLLLNDFESRIHILKNAKCEMSQIVEKKQIDSLWRLGLPENKKILKIMKNIAPQSLAPNTGFRLIGISGHVDAMQRLGHLKKINTALLYFFDGWDPAVHPVEPVFLEAVSRDLTSMFTYGVMREFIRGQDLFRDLRPGRTLPRWRTIASMHEQVQQLEEEHQIARQEALAAQVEAQAGLEEQELKRRWPPPPIPGNENIQPITSPLDLYREGQDMHHCVGHYARLVPHGRMYVYRILSPERATLRIEFHHMRWRNAELRGPCNASVTDELSDMVQDWLDAYQLGV